MLQSEFCCEVVLCCAAVAALFTLWATDMDPWGTVQALVIFQLTVLTFIFGEVISGGAGTVNDASGPDGAE